MATTSKNGQLFITDGTDRVNWFPITKAVNVETTGGGDVETELSGKYELPSGGIPSSDLASAVQTSLGKADTAVQPAAIATMQTTGNLVTSVSVQSTDAQYPSAKCLYDLVGNIESLLAAI